MKSNAACRAIDRTSCLAVTDRGDRPDGLCASIAAFQRLPGHRASPHVMRVIKVATRQFLRNGYTLTNVATIAKGAGVSTRTIYKTFKNKAGLWASVVSWLIMHDAEVVLAAARIDTMQPRPALTAIGQFIYTSACAPDAVSLFRILATDAQRFPDLVAEIRGHTKLQLEDAVINYLHSAIARGILTVADPARAASLFVQMVCAELRECLLFGRIEEIAQLAHTRRLDLVVEIFLNGVGNPRKF